MGKITVAVIGAGVTGLTSAYSVKLFDESIDVTVFAEHFSPNTTGDVAAGINLFSKKGMRDTPKHLLEKWWTSSYNWVKENCRKEQAAEMGISLASGYLLSDLEKLTFFSNIETWLSMVDHQWLTPQQLKDFGPEIRSGVFATSFICECRKYLPWLLKRFMEKNGKICQRKIKSFDELASYDIIINCCGLGAVELCQDKEMQPSRGQVARIKAPWIRHWYHIEYQNSEPNRTVYVYPNNECVIVGGTRVVSWDRRPSDKTHQQIFEEVEKLVPSLKHAEFLKDYVGLRPSRSSVRLEREDRTLKAGPNDTPRTVKIVHNYGQGPSGVTLSWGCAQHVVELVAKCIEEISRKEAVSKL